MKVKRLMVVDLSNFIFRAFYAIRPLNAPDGTPVNALYGVFNMLQKMVTVYKPSHLIIAKDSGRDTFRKELYPEYKANRLETPEDLAPQFALIDQLIEAMEMPTLVMPKYEADDVIGSIVTQWKKNCEEVLIASSDKDLMQFVGGHVSMLDAVKGKILATDDVCDKMGVRPDQIVDYLSMVGDSSDNIPGMRGIGAKGAAKLLAEHQTLENCIAASGEFGNKRVKNAFENHLDDAYLSKKLITIVTNLELALGLEDTSFNLQVTPALLELLKGWGFNSAIRKLEGQKNAASSGAKNEPLPSSAVESVATTDQSDVVDPLPSRPSAKFFRIDNQESWQQLLLKIKQCESITVDLSCSPLVLAISLDGSVAHLIDQECGELINQSLKDIFRLNSIKVVCWNAKEIYRYMLSSLPQLQLPTTLIDLMGAAYLCDPSGKNSLADSLERYINISFPSIKLDKLSPDELRQLKADQVVLIHQLHGPLTIRLDELNLITLFSTVELEVTRILSKMEHVGICLNLPLFDQLEQQLEDQLAGIEFEMVTQISACNIEGSDQINLRSSKQLGELLFNQLGFPVIKKNKSGPSTDSEVMRELMLQVDSPIPGLILKFRELDKLLSTYIRTMPKLLDHKTNRLHCHFNQFLVATGRLSSERPNLQNIPVRTESGRRIRQGFIAAPGKVLLSADYSQIELRLVAHLAQDPTMLDAFERGVDIHTQTAAQINKISIADVSGQERSMAKAVNFGLIYGQSAFGLSKSLGISRGEAAEYIVQYFEHFSQIKVYLDTLKESCTELGYAETMFGRKRFIPEIYSSNRNVKSMAEREAINSPIQGSAADLIKKAMILVDKKMQQKNLQSKMLLQVHDELIFEVEESELPSMQELVKREMEGVVKLSVPLVVDMGFGVSWYHLK